MTSEASMHTGIHDYASSLRNQPTDISATTEPPWGGPQMNAQAGNVWDGGGTYQQEFATAYQAPIADYVPPSVRVNTASYDDVTAASLDVSGNRRGVPRAGQSQPNYHLPGLPSPRNSLPPVQESFGGGHSQLLALRPARPGFATEPDDRLVAHTCVCLTKFSFD